MKIDPNILIGNVTGKQAAGKQAAVPANAFEDILKGVQEPQVTEKNGVQAMNALNTLDPQKIRALSLSEQAVDMLDAYSKGLSDPKLSLKDVAPMVDELDSMRSEIVEAKSFLSDNDPLKSVMDEVASTINGEVLRFRRGDLIG